MNIIKGVYFEKSRYKTYGNDDDGIRHFTQFVFNEEALKVKTIFKALFDSDYTTIFVSDEFRLVWYSEGNVDEHNTRDIM
jgi:hypothetical protein